MDETLIRERLTARLKVWWGPGEDVTEQVDELLIDLGYVPKPVALRRRDPVAYREHQRAYMREWRARRASSAE